MSLGVVGEADAFFACHSTLLLPRHYRVLACMGCVSFARVRSSSHISHDSAPKLRQIRSLPRGGRDGTGAGSCVGGHRPSAHDLGCREVCEQMGGADSTERSDLPFSIFEFALNGRQAALNMPANKSNKNQINQPGK